jgi:hypothetical protein
MLALSLVIAVLAAIAAGGTAIWLHLRIKRLDAKYTQVLAILNLQRHLLDRVKLHQTAPARKPGRRWPPHAGVGERQSAH